MRSALGLIEAVGLTSAVTALDAACKAADVTLVGYEKVIGVGGAVSVTLQLVGEVAAVKASIEAGVLAAKGVGQIVSHKVIPRPHEEVDTLIKKFQENLKHKKKKQQNEEKDSGPKKNKEEL